MQHQTVSADETRIRAVIEQWAAALRRKDAAGVVADHADDFVQFSLAPPLISTAASVEGLEAWFATWRGGLAYELRDLRLTIGGDVAFAHCLTHLAGTKTDGEVSDLWFRQSFGLCKVAGEWKFAHQHQSVPFYMDGSYRAAIDLRP